MVTNTNEFRLRFFSTFDKSNSMLELVMTENFCVHKQSIFFDAKKIGI